MIKKRCSFGILRITKMVKQIITFRVLKIGTKNLSSLYKICKQNSKEYTDSRLQTLLYQYILHTSILTVTYPVVTASVEEWEFSKIKPGQFISELGGTECLFLILDLFNFQMAHSVKGKNQQQKQQHPAKVNLWLVMIAWYAITHVKDLHKSFFVL